MDSKFDAGPTSGKDAAPSTAERKNLYKVRTSSMGQNERRNLILEKQKRNRNEEFNARRNFNFLEHPNESAADEDEEAMECSHNSPRKHKQNLKYANQLMQSEWLMDVPADLEDKWYFMLCPAGKRCLVVAHRRKTCAYSSKGKLIATFQSHLPGGSVYEDRRSNISTRYTVLDCVFSFHSSTYYVLDVLAWGNQPMLECETEFRFCWLKSQLSDIDGITDHSKSNKYSFVNLPFWSCEKNELELAMNSPLPFPEVVDGVLFYHREAHYTHGPSPLVVWLLPFMLPEVLSIPVSEAHAAQQPTNYQGHVEFVKRFQEQSRSERHKDYCARKTASRAVLDSAETSMESQTCEAAEENPHEDDFPLG